MKTLGIIILITMSLLIFSKIRLSDRINKINDRMDVLESSIPVTLDSTDLKVIPDTINFIIGQSNGGPLPLPVSGKLCINN